MTDPTPNEDPTEADIVHLLGAYADALEGSHSGSDQNQTTGNRRPSGIDTPGRERKVEMNEDQSPVELEVTPVEQKRASRGRVLVGALAIGAAALIGGVVIANQGDSTELNVTEVAEDDSDNTADDNTNDADDTPADGGQAEDTSNEGADSASDSAVAVSTSAEGFGFGPAGVVFADGEFVSIGSGPEGVFVARSTDGTDWSTTPVTGLPDNANASLLAKTESGWATMVEIWPEMDEDHGASPFVGEVQPERLLASSTDLVEWTTTELPDLELGDNTSAWVNAIAGAGDRLAIMLQIHPDGPEELRILFDEGVITEDDLENYCGSDFTEGGPIVGYSCDFTEEAQIVDDGEDEAPPVATPDDEGRQELFRLEPGDTGYDAVVESYAAAGDSEMQAPIVLSGAIDGPFEVNELPATGYSSSLVATSDGFVAVVSSGAPAVVLSSPDGATWALRGDLGADVILDSIAVSGDRLLGVGSTFDDSAPGTVHAWVSDDLGATWASGAIDTQLFGAYGMPIGGPAGFAVLLNGSTEPYEDPFSELGPVNIEKDGYTMVMDLGTSISTLIGPDGVVIHESISLQQLLEGDADNVARTEDFGDVIVWLDPETGEDLVSVAEADFDAAFEQTFGEDPSTIGSEFEEPSSGTEIWFSDDGVIWTLLEQSDGNGEGSHTSTAAVGDDEVILRSETFVQAPDELLTFEQENREPTPEEIAALDSYFADRAENSTEWRSISVG